MPFKPYQLDKWGNKRQKMFRLIKTIEKVTLPWIFAGMFAILGVAFIGGSQMTAPWINLGRFIYEMLWYFSATAITAIIVYAFLAIIRYLLFHIATWYPSCVYKPYIDIWFELIEIESIKQINLCVKKLKGNNQVQVFLQFDEICGKNVPELGANNINKPKQRETVFIKTFDNNETIKKLIATIKNGKMTLYVADEIYINFPPDEYIYTFNLRIENKGHVWDYKKDEIPHANIIFDKFGNTQVGNIHTLKKRNV